MREPTPSSRSSKYLWISFAVLIVSFLILLNYLCSDIYKKIYEYTQAFVQDLTVSHFLLLSLLNTAFLMFMVPGFSIFVVSLGYVAESYLKSVLILLPSSILVMIAVYLISKHLFREKVKSLLSQKWYFQCYYEESKAHPWRVSIFLRVLLIPITYKNYLIPLMEISFVPYIVPAVIFNFVYSSCYIFIGQAIGNIQDLINGKISIKEDKYIYYLAFLLTMVLSSVAIIISMVVFTIKKVKEQKMKHSKCPVVDSLIEAQQI